MSKKGNLYYLLGDEGLRAEAVSDIAGKFSTGNDPQEILRYYGDDLSFDDFVNQAQTFPFLSKTQCLLLSYPERLKKSDQDRLAAFLPNVPQTTLLICQSPAADKRTVLYKTFVKAGEVREFRIDYAAQVERNAKAFLSDRGKRIRRDALCELMECLGGNTMLIFQALEQIATFVGTREEIVSSDVQTFVEREAPYGPFELADAIGDRNVAKMLTVFRFLMDRMGQDALELVGLIHWQIRRLWDAKRRLGQGKTDRDLCRELAIPPFAVGKLVQACRRFSEAELSSACERLFYLDWKLKTGRAEGEKSLEDFLMRWCAGDRNGLVKREMQTARR